MASLGLFFVVRNQQIATDNAYATATARAKSVTAAAQANASATMDAALTATASANPYPPNTGRLLFSDPLSQPLNWAERSDSDGSGCHFLNEAYHVTLRTAACSYSTNHGKFVFEVQMTIVTGQCGAIGGGDVDVNICRDGTYGIYIYSNSLHNFKTVKTA